MNIKQRMALHDRLYRHADNIIKKRNPCKIEGKYCLCGKNPCCDYCNYLTEKGCSVECLRCKLYLCYRVQETDPKAHKMLKRLQKQAHRHDLLFARNSKEELFDYIATQKR